LRKVEACLCRELFRVNFGPHSQTHALAAIPILAAPFYSLQYKLQRYYIQDRCS
jgi:hypothetical protein